MKKLMFFCFVLFMGMNLSATNYYFSNTGNDSGIGTIIDPWQTLNKAYSISGNRVAGDSILFRRGDTFISASDNWSEVLYIRNSGSSGNPICYGAYGSGAKPILSGIASVTGWNTSGNWTNTSGNIWRISWARDSSSRLWINEVERKKCATSTVTSDESFYTDGTYLYVYSTSNPATAFSSMQSHIDKAGIVLFDLSYVSFVNLDIQHYTTSIELHGCNYITISNCNIGYNSTGYGVFIGRQTSGSNFITITHNTLATNDIIQHTFDAGSTQDGIQIGADSHNIEVSYNNFISWDHAAYYLINTIGTYTITNTKCHNNYFYDENDYGYATCADINNYTSTGNEIYNNFMDRMKRRMQLQAPYLSFHNNLIIGTTGIPFSTDPSSDGISLSGYGAPPQYMIIANNVFANCNGHAINFHTEAGYFPISNNIIANNIFYNNKGENKSLRGVFTYTQLYIDDDATVLNNTFNNNLFYATGVTDLVYYGHSTTNDYPHTIAEFNAENGTDSDVITNNIGGDPLFTSSTDFHLKSTSPAINVGVDVGLTTDYLGNNIVGLPDLGAYEYQPPVVLTKYLTGTTGKPQFVNGKLQMK